MVASAPIWLFFAIGILTTTYILSKLLLFLHLHLRPSSLPRYAHGPQPWALVTGASDGLGFALAHELCRRGSFSIILHGRNADKLSLARSRLAAAFPGCSFRVWIADATADPARPIAHLLSAIIAPDNLRLTTLVNNVGSTAGFVSADFKPFAAHTPGEIAALRAANAALLPVLVRNGPALVLNVGTTGLAGAPYLSVYAATKAYVGAWSFGLKAEMAAEGLDVEVHAVLSGSTQSNQNRKPVGLFRPSAETWARAAVGKVGCGRAVVTPYVSRIFFSSFFSIFFP